MFRKTLIAAGARGALRHRALAAVSADEAKQLGTTLTAGRRREGRQQGRHDSRVHRRPEGRPGVVQEGQRHPPDPVREREAAPRHHRQGRRAARRQADRGHEGAAQALSRRCASTCIRRIARGRAAARKVLDNTAKNATGAKSVERRPRRGGHAAGYPVPDSEDAAPRRCGTTCCATPASATTARSTRTGTSTRPACRRSRPRATLTDELPLYDPKDDGADQGQRSVLASQALLHRARAPRRRSADGRSTRSTRSKQPRRAWQYLPGPAPREARAGPRVRHAEPGHRGRRRRTRRRSVFNGAMDRFDWKLVGKKEMYVPYNGYKLMYAQGRQAGAHQAEPPQSGLHALGAASRVGRGGDAQARPARPLQQARVLPRRGQLDRARRRPVRRQAASSIARRFAQPDVQLRRERGERSTTRTRSTTSARASYNIVGLLRACPTASRYIDPLPELQWSSEALAGAGIR